MDIDGYILERDEDYSGGERYWVYKDNQLKGWVCFFLGILRVTYCNTKDSLGSPFLFHECYGENCVDEFSTGKERRAALSKAVSLLQEHYGDHTDPLRTITAIFPGAVVDQSQEQLTMF